MDVKTLTLIMIQQMQDTMGIVSQLQNEAYTAYNLADQENSAPEINPQIKSLMGTANILIASLNSQAILVQQTVDKLSEITAS